MTKAKSEASSQMWKAKHLSPEPFFLPMLCVEEEFSAVTSDEDHLNVY